MQCLSVDHQKGVVCVENVFDEVVLIGHLDERLFVLTADLVVWVAAVGFLDMRNIKKVAYVEALPAASRLASFELRVCRLSCGYQGGEDDDDDID